MPEKADVSFFCYQTGSTCRPFGTGAAGSVATQLNGLIIIFTLKLRKGRV